MDSTSKDILLKNIRSIPDFPKSGILFKDITPLLGDYHTLNLTLQLLIEPFKNQNIDYVAGLESRGFLFGPGMAKSLQAGFVPIRKPNKLPAETISQTYDLEYGTDSLEIHKDAIEKGANVIIHDDLIATGGTALAAAKLIEELGGNIIGFSFIMEIDFLAGRDILPKMVPYHTLLTV